MFFKHFKLLSFLVVALSINACQSGSDSASTEKEEEQVSHELAVSKSPFGETPDGPANLYTLTNTKGMVVKISNYGGIVTSIIVPDSDGKFTDIALGYESLEPYLLNSPYFGAIIGRYGNRIAKGKFNLDGQTYTLAKNNGENHLHGGTKGFDKVLWSGTEVKRAQSVGVQLDYVSADGEEGYPGNLTVKVLYLLNDKNELEIQYEASTDKKTICNLTNHTYFNLGGPGSGDILNHQMMINASQFTPLDANLIPTGELASLTSSPLDFRKPKLIVEALKVAGIEQLQFGKGIDHNYVLNKRGAPGELELAASVFEPRSGRVMEVFTTEPGVQFYTGNLLNGSLIGKQGKAYQFRHGFCLETQHFPDSPNKPDFPSVVLEPGETYSSKTVYKFSAAIMAGQ